MTKLYLKKGREESLQRFHPWVFSGAVGGIEGPDPAEGDAVAVYSSSKEFLGWGHFQIGSIAVRMLSFSDDMPAGGPDTAFWTERLQGCLNARRAFGLADAAATNCYRLVHGEGDGLPGLIVDWYDGVCVMQAHSAGMFRAKEQISKAARRLRQKLRDGTLQGES